MLEDTLWSICTGWHACCLAMPSFLGGNPPDPSSPTLGPSYVLLSTTTIVSSASPLSAAYIRSRARSNTEATSIRIATMGASALRAIYRQEVILRPERSDQAYSKLVVWGRIFFSGLAFCGEVRFRVSAILGFYFSTEPWLTPTKTSCPLRLE